jgi:prepilin-type processing-associated H-X9-DG protein
MMEQQAMFSQVDFSVGAYASENGTVRVVQIPALACPSDYMNAASSGGTGLTVSASYAACFGGDAVAIDTDNNGLMFLNSSIGYQQIRDGASNTILLGEKIHVPKSGDLGWMSGTRATLRNTGVAVNQSWDSRTQFTDGTGGLPVLKIPDDSTVGGYSSRHVGGAQFALADGSVRFISRNIDADTFSWLGNREDLKIVGDF